MAFPIGAAIGLGTSLLSLFGKKKPKSYQTPMSKEDLARRNTWLNYLAKKSYGTNVGQNAWGNALGILGNYQQTPPNLYGTPQGQGSQPMAGQSFGAPSPTPQGAGNPYAGLFAGRVPQQGQRLGARF